MFDFLHLGQLSTGALVIYMVLLVVIMYFGLANSTIQLINYFHFYRPFSKKLEKFGAFQDPAYINLIKSRLIGNLFVFLLTLVVSLFMCWRTGGVGYATGFITLIAGILLYSKNLRYELWNVQHFAHQYQNYLDKEKFTRFLRAEYDISLEKLSDKRFVLQRIRKGK